MEHEPCEPRLLLGVDLVRGVAHLVVVRMQPGREEEDRHALLREVVVVRAEKEPFLWPEIAERLDVQDAGWRGHAGERRAAVGVLPADTRDRGLGVAAT